MNLALHFAIAPIVIPALAAPLALLVMRRRRWLGLSISFASCFAMLAAAIGLLVQSSDGVIRTYELGGWEAPFGIVLVIDRLAAIMLVLAAIMALLALLHAVLTRTDRIGWHFHPLLQFQLLGLNGAFLTGDLFNLFVFFEVLLIASYGLMVHGQGPARLKAGVQYVVVNIIGSSLFLVALGLLYALTGTLNMAQMGLRVAEIGPDDQWLLRVAALLLVSVFALKAALVPLHLWLPRTYAVATPAVAALFAIMTKVGVYSLIRVVPQVFGDDAGSAAWAPAPYLLPAAIITAVVGFAGVFVARRLSEQGAYAIIGSTGTLMIAVAAWQVDTLGAALYYLVHSTLAGAALFLVADVAARRRAGFGDAIASGPAFAQRQAVGLLFLVAAVATVGLPPLSGFIGKLLIMEALVKTVGWGWAWAAILITTLAGVIGFARAGSAVFWKEDAASGTASSGASSGASRAAVAGEAQAHGARGDMTAPFIALVLLAALTAGAGPATGFAKAAAAQVLDAPSAARAVLGAG